jgi:hypothetical protein
VYLFSHGYPGAYSRRMREERSRKSVDWHAWLSVGHGCGVGLGKLVPREAARSASLVLGNPGDRCITPWSMNRRKVR